MEIPLALKIKGGMDSAVLILLALPTLTSMGLSVFALTHKIFVNRGNIGMDKGAFFTNKFAPNSHNGMVLFVFLISAVVQLGFMEMETDAFHSLNFVLHPRNGMEIGAMQALTVRILPTLETEVAIPTHHAREVNNGMKI